MTFCSWSTCSFLELLLGHCNLGFFLVQSFVIVSRLESAEHVFFAHCGVLTRRLLCSVPAHGLWCLTVSKGVRSVLTDRSFSWLLTLDTFLTVVDLSWMNTLSCPSSRPRGQETRSSQEGQDRGFGNSAGLGIWNNHKGYPLLGAIELLYLPG